MTRIQAAVDKARGDTVMRQFAPLLLRLAAHLGVRVSPPPTVAGDLESHMPLSELLSLWQHLVEAAANPHFGLLMGEELAILSAQHVVGQLFTHCDTVGDALETLCEYHNVLVSATQPTLDQSTLALTGALVDPQLAEAILANLALTIRRSSAGRVVPREVSFAHEAPSDTRPLQRIFGQHLVFGQEPYSLRYAAGDLDVPLLLSNPRLRWVLEGYVRELRGRIEVDRPLSSRLVDHLWEQLAAGRPSLKSIAKAMAMSPRSLQRQLREEGTSFRAMLDRVRCEAARRALRDPKQPLAAVAQAVGFADQSAFQRAFRRWTGETPLQHRHRTTGNGDARGSSHGPDSSNR